MTPQGLRNSILTLAFKGKLVENSKFSGDSYLKELKIKPSSIDSDELWDIPEQWTFVLLKDIVEIYTGKKDANFGGEKGQYPFYTCSNKPIKADSYSYNGEFLIMPGNGANIGMVFYESGPFEAYQRTYLLENTHSIYLPYLKYHLESNWKKYNNDKMFGSAIPYIKLGNLQNYPVAFPCLEEQKRIVEKIEELLSLVDRYEEAWNKLEKFNKKFPGDMERSIIKLAIEGKLVEQIESEGTGKSVLIDIKKTKQELIKNKLIKQEKEFDPILEEEKPFEIPNNWCWARFGELGSYKKGPFGSALTKDMFVPKGPHTIKVYEQKNAIKKNANLGDYYIKKAYFEEHMKGFEVFPGDIIVSCAGTIGETYVLPENIEKGIINQALMRMKIFEPFFIPYFLLFFDAILKKNAKAASSGSAIKNIPPFDVLKNYLVPIPPLGEQKRIFKKVEVLLPLCRKLIK